MKSCSKCQQCSPAVRFATDNSRHDGLSVQCTDCQQTYRAGRSEKISQKDRDYYQANKPIILAQQLAYRKANPDKVLQTRKKYKASHPEQIRVIRVRHDVKHKPAVQRALHVRKQRYRHNNHAAVLAREKEYRAEHPEIHRAAKRRHTARKLGAEVSDFTHAQWIFLQEHFNHCCAYCGKRAKGHLTQDHITPLSKGGNHTLSNIVPACRSCNCRKGAGEVLSPVQPVLLYFAAAGYSASTASGKRQMPA